MRDIAQCNPRSVRGFFLESGEVEFSDELANDLGVSSHTRARELVSKVFLLPNCTTTNAFPKDFWVVRGRKWTTESLLIEITAPQNQGKERSSLGRGLTWMQPFFL